MAKSIYFDKIEAYLTGQLAPDEVRAFEREAANNEQIATELNLQQLEHEAMELMLEKDLKNKMTTWADAPPANSFLEKGEAKIVRMDARKRWPLLRVAAVAGGIFLTVALYQYLNRQDPADNIANEPPKKEMPPEPPINEVPNDETQVVGTPDEPVQKERPPAPEREKKRVEKPAPKSSSYLALAAATYQVPPPFASGLKSGNAMGEKSALLQAAEAFDGGHFADALDLLGPPKGDEQSTVRYLRGHVYFQLKKYGTAATEFAVVASSEFLPNYQEAQWYLLLSYLAQMPERKNEFEVLAKQLAGDEYSDYREGAKELLEKVK